MVQFSNIVGREDLGFCAGFNRDGDLGIGDGGYCGGCGAAVETNGCWRDQFDVGRLE
jgi:hypothetical protein